jgi:hypothetical protein
MLRHNPPNVEIRKTNGIPRLYVNGEVVPTIAYRNRIHHGFAYMKKFADSGHRIFFMTHPRHFDQPQSEYWKAVDENVRTILGFNDETLVILGMYLGVDEEWARQHPDDIARAIDGSPAPRAEDKNHGGLITMPYSLFSREFEKEGVRQAKAHVEWAKKHPLGHRIIGFFIEAGAAQEWIPFNRGDQMDYAPVVTVAFGEWLRKKYRTNAALRKAWKMKEVTFDTATPPTQKDQEATTRGDFFDPSLGRRVIDFQQCYMQNVGDRIHAVCRAAKQGGEGRLVGIFHEPPMEVGPHDHAWQQVMEDPDIDFFAGPPCYESRKAGQPIPLHHLLDSLRLLGKLHFLEEDTRPHTMLKLTGAAMHCRTRDESRQTISRSMLHAFAKGTLAWYWDFQYRWFTEPWFFGFFRRLQDIGAAVQAAKPKSAAEVAVFVDEGSIPYTRGDNSLLSNLGHRLLIHEINRMGCPHDIYLFDHVRRSDLPDYRLYIFLNTFRVTDAQRRAVKRLRGDGKVLFFHHAAGFINDDAKVTASVDNIADLTGMHVKEFDVRYPTTVVTADRDHPIVNALPVGFTFGQFPRYLRRSLSGGTDEDPIFPRILPVSPVFSVDDAEAVSLGYYAFDELPPPVATSRRTEQPKRNDDSRYVGFAAKHGPDWTSIYAGVVAWTSELMRGLARYAGAHIYLDTDDTFYANDRLLVLHTNWRPGKTRTIRLRTRTNVYDLVAGGKQVAKEAREFTIPVKPKTTYAFFLGKRSPSL